MSAAASIHHVAVGDTRLAVHTAGGGLPLLLLHGFPLDHAMWAAQEPLAEHGRLVVPDQRGFGASPGPGPTSMEELADDAAALLAALHCGPAVVCGLSMGGYVAFAMWRLGRARIRGLVLADTRAGADSADARARRRQMLSLLAEKGTGSIAAAMLPGLLGETTRRSRPGLVAQVRGLIEANAPQAIAAAIGAMMDRPDSTPGLPEIGVPARLIVGEEDTLTPQTLADEMRRLLRAADLVTIPEAGHLSNLEAPQAFNAALADYLARR